jgi:hypothetical protein
VRCSTSESQKTKKTHHSEKMRKLQKIYLFLTVFGLLGCSESAFSQVLDMDDLLNPSLDLSEWTSGGTKSSVFINQTGRINEAQILQDLTSQPVVGQTNLIRVMQLGEANLAQIVSVGQSNQTDLLQNGSNNQVVSNVSGNLNKSQLIQNGNSNAIIQNLVNSNAINTNFQQNGDNNRIEQTLTNQNNLPVRIIQNGNGLNAIINQ